MRRQRDRVVRACLQMLDDSDTHEEFYDRAAQYMGWHFQGGRREVRKRFNQYWNEQCQRHFPAKLIALCIEVTGLDYVTPILLRVPIRAEEQPAAEIEAPRRSGPVAVRREQEWRDVG